MKGVFTSAVGITCQGFSLHVTPCTHTMSLANAVYLHCVCFTNRCPELLVCEPRASFAFFTVPRLPTAVATCACDTVVTTTVSTATSISISSSRSGISIIEVRVAGYACRLRVAVLPQSYRRQQGERSNHKASHGG